MLLNREISPLSDGQEEDSYIINLRHYAITTRLAGIPRRIRRLDPKEQQHKDRREGTLPNLGRLDDISEYLLDPAATGYTSPSETELDTDAEVEVMETSARKVLSKREMQRVKSGGKRRQSVSNSGVEKRAVKLVELGPRMRLKMMKVEEGVCGGKVMWHDFVTKSETEARELDKAWETRRKQKELRRQEQRENIEKKREGKAIGKDTGNHSNKGDEEGSTDDEWDSESFEVDGDDDNPVEG
jgi:ribosome biogenesis protein SSF1/2